MLRAAPTLFQRMRPQSLISLLLFSTVALTAVGLDLLARNEPLARLLKNLEWHYYEETRTLFHDVDAGYFIDFNDRMVNEELPAADYSKGGVYIIGASEAKLAVTFRDVVPQLRGLIHDYGIATGDHSREFQFLRYLIEHDRLLRAGGNKTLVCFAVSYHDIINATASDQYIANLWERHGLYHYSLEEGIQPLAVNPVWRFIHFEKVRISGFMHQIGKNLMLEYYCRFYSATKLERKLDPQLYNQERAGLEPRWGEMLDQQLSEFGQAMDYLRTRGVHMVVVLLPQGSWEDNLPFEREYSKRVNNLCRTKQVPLEDWSRMLPDEDFGDSTHVNVFGMEKLTSRFLELAIQFLHSTQAMPEPAAGR
jgi:hypothetical protein